MTHLYYATSLLALLVFKTDACSFPSELNGTWYSSIKGVLNFTTESNVTSITGYAFDKFGVLDLSCFTSSGDTYIFQSSQYSYYGLQWYAYVCFTLYPQSTVKFMYNIGSAVNTDADNERIKTLLITSTVTQTVATICDRSDYHIASEHMFLKNDGNEEDAKVAFPYQLRGFWNYNFDSGNGNLCGVNSEANICDSPDFSTVAFNYTLCSAIQAYSATGTLYLMYYTYNSSVYYMTVFNTDITTDESTTYRFTCYVLQISGNTMYATQYPKECISAQNSTYVASPGATVVFARRATCPFDTSSTVVSMAATAGIVIAVLVVLVIIICGVLIFYYYKKRKEKEARDKLPLQKSQPANVRLANGDLFKDSKPKETKTPVRTQNGDVKVNMDDLLGSIRREDSICLSVASRVPSVLPGQSETASRNGPAPVEEPEKVNDLSDNVIEESDNETTLASTFLPIPPAEKQLLNFSPREIAEKEAENSKEKEIDMDEVDDELGLPRLSRAAFTPVVDPEPAPLPTLLYKKLEPESESEEERTKDGIKKVKLKKKKKKIRVTSAKGHVKGARPKSAVKQKTGREKEFPFLERIKKSESDKHLIEVKPLSESRQSLTKSIDRKTPEKAPETNEVKRARSGKGTKKARPKTGSKYVVDSARDPRLRTADKGALRAPSSEQRRRFGDPPTSSNRKRTPRLRHPMEVQGDGRLFEPPSSSSFRRPFTNETGRFSEGEEAQEHKEIRQNQKEVTDKEEKRARSGRRRGNTESAIPSVKEDPFDYRERPITTSTFSEARNGKSAGLRLDRENSAFIDPPSRPAETNVWSKASNMWLFKNQPSYGNLGHK